MNKATANHFTIEIGDKLECKYRLKQTTAGAQEVKMDQPVTLIIGEDNLFPGLDARLLGESTATKKVVVDNFVLPATSSIYPNETVHLGLRVVQHIKNSSEQPEPAAATKESQVATDETSEPTVTEANDLGSKRDAKRKELRDKVAALEAHNQRLLEKNQKLEAELAANLLAFKAKQEELSQKAQAEVVRIRDEIKTKAKAEINDNKKYILQQVLTELLTPLDTLYRSINFGATQADPTLSAYTKGFSLLTDQIFQILANHGLKLIEPQIGEDYDAEFHDVHELVSGVNFQPNQIVKVLTRGYMLNERVLKPAKVDVSKN